MQQLEEFARLPLALLVILDVQGTEHVRPFVTLERPTVAGAHDEKRRCTVVCDRTPLERQPGKLNEFLKLPLGNVPLPRGKL